MSQLDEPTTCCPPGLPSNFQITRLLSQGSCAQVFAALDMSRHVYVAIKVLDERATPDQRQRFAQECRIHSGLRHPNIVRVHGYSSIDTPAWLVTDLCDKNLLTALRANENPSLHDRLQWAFQLLKALSYMHERGFIHRDVKPSNILLRSRRVQLADFGLSLQCDERTADNAAGTTGYLAPELTRGAPPSSSSDVFAAGTTIWRMFSDLPMPGAIENVLARSTSVDPSDRFTNATAFFSALTGAADRVDSKVFAQSAPTTTASIFGQDESTMPAVATARKRSQGKAIAWIAAVAAPVSILAGAQISAPVASLQDASPSIRPTQPVDAQAELGATAAEEDPILLVGRVTSDDWLARWTFPATEADLRADANAESVDDAARVPAPPEATKFDSYLVTAAPQTSDLPTLSCRSTQSSCTLKHLAPGTKYEVTISAYMNDRLRYHLPTPVSVHTPPAFLYAPGLVGLWLDAGASQSLFTAGQAGLSPGDAPDTWVSLERHRSYARVEAGQPTLGTTHATGQQTLSLSGESQDKLEIRGLLDRKTADQLRRTGGYAVAAIETWGQPPDDEERPVAIEARILPDGGIDMRRSSTKAPVPSTLVEAELPPRLYRSGALPSGAISPPASDGHISTTVNISEYIFLTRRLTSSERAELRRYLAEKWDLARPPEKVSSPTVDVAESGEVQVNWVPGAALDMPSSYHLRLKGGGPGECRTENDWVGVCTGLRPGSVYRVEITPMNPAGKGPAVESEPFSVPPGPPR